MNNFHSHETRALNNTNQNLIPVEISKTSDIVKKIHRYFSNIINQICNFLDRR
jgi:hypothetical protein